MCLRKNLYFYIFEKQFARPINDTISIINHIEKLFKFVFSSLTNYSLDFYHIIYIFIQETIKTLTINIK